MAFDIQDDFMQEKMQNDSPDNGLERFGIWVKKGPEDITESTDGANNAADITSLDIPDFSFTEKTETISDEQTCTEDNGALDEPQKTEITPEESNEEEKLAPDFPEIEDISLDSFDMPEQTEPAEPVAVAEQPEEPKEEEKPAPDFPEIEDISLDSFDMPEQTEPAEPVAIAEQSEVTQETASTSEKTEITDNFDSAFPTESEFLPPEDCITSEEFEITPDEKIADTTFQTDDFTEPDTTTPIIDDFSTEELSETTFEDIEVPQLDSALTQDIPEIIEENDLNPPEAIAFEDNVESESPIEDTLDEAFASFGIDTPPLSDDSDTDVISQTADDTIEADTDAALPDIADISDEIPQTETESAEGASTAETDAFEIAEQETPLTDDAFDNVFEPTVAENTQEDSNAFASFDIADMPEVYPSGEPEFAKEGTPSIDDFSAPDVSTFEDTEIEKAEDTPNESGELEVSLEDFLDDESNDVSADFDIPQDSGFSVTAEGSDIGDDFLAELNNEFSGKKEEEAELSDEKPIDIDLEFDDQFVSDVQTDASDRIEDNSDFSDIVTTDSADVEDNFDDMFSNIQDEAAKPEEQADTNASAMGTFDVVDDFDDILASVSGPDIEAEKAHTKKTQQIIDYDITVSTEDADTQKAPTVEVSDDFDTNESIPLFSAPITTPEEEIQPETETQETESSEAEPLIEDMILPESEPVVEVQPEAETQETESSVEEPLAENMILPESEPVVEVQPEAETQEIESSVEEPLIEDVILPESEPVVEVQPEAETQETESSEAEPLIEDVILPENEPEIEILSESESQEPEESVEAPRLDDMISVGSEQEEEILPQSEYEEENKELDITEKSEYTDHKEDEYNMNFDDITQAPQESGNEEAPAKVATEPISNNSDAVLKEISNELSILRSEISQLKAELESIRREPAAANSLSETLDTDIPTDGSAQEEKTSTPEMTSDSSSGFFDNDVEDETIALSGDELSNILNSADFTEEFVDNTNENKASFLDDEQPVLTEDTYTDENVPSIATDIDFDEKLEEPDLESMQITEMEGSDDIPEEISVPKVDDLISDPEENAVEETITEETPAEAEIQDDFIEKTEPITTDSLSNDTLKYLEEDSAETLPDFVEPEAIAEPEQTPDFEEPEVPVQTPLEDEAEITSPAFEDVLKGNSTEETNTSFDDIVPEESVDMSSEQEPAVEFTEEEPQEAIPEEITETPVFEESEDVVLDNSPFIEPDDKPAEEVFDSDQWKDSENTEPETTVQENDSEMPIDVPADTTVSEPIKEESSVAESVEEPVATDEKAPISTDLKDEIKSVLVYMDQLLENLPEEKIEEFAKSDYFETYKKLFKELGLS